MATVYYLDRKFQMIFSKEHTPGWGWRDMNAAICRWPVLTSIELLTTPKHSVTSVHTITHRIKRPVVFWGYPSWLSLMVWFRHQPIRKYA